MKPFQYKHSRTFTNEFSLCEISLINKKYIKTTLKELFNTTRLDIKNYLTHYLLQEKRKQSFSIKNVMANVMLEIKAEARNSYSKSGGRKTFNTERIIHRTDLDNINTILSDLINELHYKANTNKLEHLIIPETIRIVVKFRVDVIIGVKYIVNNLPPMV